MDLPDYEFLRVTSDAPVLLVTLNRAEAQNALSTAFVAEIADLFDRLQTETGHSVILLDAAGPRFCVGTDLKELDGAPGDTILTAMAAQRRLSRAVIAMRSCPHVIVARLQGVAAGGGMALALASDLRIAARDFRMNAAFIKVGLSGCDIGVSYFLPRMIGAARAARYLYTGDFIDAAEGERLGLFTEVTDDLDAAVARHIDALRAKAPLGLRLTKEALNHAIDAPSLAAVVAMEDRNQILSCANGDFTEGINAFREGRAPAYPDTARMRGA